ncbi:hypothetical protein MettiDRAFT_2374 [Methanolobus tindarius DSM 2278]|uniref:Uncharacterized protein n=1 Tax=Methanolobus tindarius DSM 2278 TaxID=1090322 RepID=W9DZT6_METTI|nr:hypothetical protein MettiDRAFT_2374 [Methanolobus tindarius DSM 2278]
MLILRMHDISVFMTKENRAQSVVPEGHRTGGLPTSEEFERLLPVVLNENKELIEALARK